MIGKTSILEIVCNNSTENLKKSSQKTTKKVTKRIELCKVNEAILRRQYIGTATKN